MPPLQQKQLRLVSSEETTVRETNDKGSVFYSQRTPPEPATFAIDQRSRQSPRKTYRRLLGWRGRNMKEIAYSEVCFSPPSDQSPIGLPWTSP
jgi:hypothetical protein